MSQTKILVTGSHRSGSTWVGKMLSLADNVLYLDEPFNLKYKKHSPFKHWFEYIDVDNAAHYGPYLDSELTGNLGSYLKNIQKAQNNTELKYRLRQNLSLFKKSDIVFKDPIAIFSTEFLVKNYGLKPVILVRHPAAVISSIKTQNWEHDFSYFFNHPKFISKYLPNYTDIIEEYTTNKKSPIEQSALLWTLIHQFIIYLKKNHPNWLFVNYEDIAKHPKDSFKALYDYANLEFSTTIASKIVEHSTSDDPNDRSSINPHTVKRKSELSIERWKANLSKEELNVIRHITLETAMELGYDAF